MGWNSSRAANVKSVQRMLGHAAAAMTLGANFTAAADKAPDLHGGKGDALRRSNFRTGTRWRETCKALGFPGLHFHALRHTGNTLAEQTRDNLLNLVSRMCHDGPRAALIYQHARSGAERAIADALDLLIAAREKLADSTAPSMTKTTIGRARALIRLASGTEMARWAWHRPD